MTTSKKSAEQSVSTAEQSKMTRHINDLSSTYCDETPETRRYNYGKKRTRNPPDVMDNIAGRIKMALGERGITQEELADRLNCDKSVVSNILRAKRDPTYIQFVEISETLGVSLDFLYRGKSTVLDLSAIDARIENAISEAMLVLKRDVGVIISETLSCAKGN